MAAVYNRALSRDEILANVAAGSGAPSPRSILSLREPDPSVLFEGEESALQISRGGETREELAVFFAADGAADYGIDYVLTTPTTVEGDEDTLLLQGGNDLQEIHLQSQSNRRPEGDEAIVLSLVSSSCYQVEGSSMMSITIRDTDADGSPHRFFTPEPYYWLSASNAPVSSGSRVVTWTGYGGAGQEAMYTDIKRPRVYHDEVVSAARFNKHSSALVLPSWDSLPTAREDILAMAVVRGQGVDTPEGCFLHMGSPEPGSEGLFVCAERGDLMFYRRLQGETVQSLGNRAERRLDASDLNLIVLGSIDGDFGLWWSQCDVTEESCWDELDLVESTTFDGLWQDDPHALLVGSTEASADFLNNDLALFDLGEVIFFERGLVSDEVDSVLSYLRSKYSVTSL